MTIKETAGKILLYFYQLQRTVPLSMQNRQLGFISKKDGGVSLTSDKKWLTDNLLAINPKSADILNAFMFLRDKGYIASKERASGEARVYVGVQILGTGIDIVEGIERGDDGKHEFNVAFNIAVKSGVDVERLISDNLSMLSE